MTTDEFRQLILDQMLATRKMRDAGSSVAEVVAEAMKADIVFGVWRDPHFPGGVNFWPIKGEALMDEVFEKGMGKASFSAIPVRDRTEVMEMRDRRERGKPNGHK